MKKVGQFILNAGLHFGALGAIIYSFLPVASWYFNYRPLWGVDFFLTTTLTNLLRSNFSAPYSFWNYAWFGGWPQFKYPLLSMYIAGLLANFFDLVNAVLLMVIGAALIFILGCYFLFFQLCRNVPLAASLAVFVGLSSGLYQTVTWAGSIPSFISQGAFPWVLGFLVSYFRNSNPRSFLAACLVAGISIWVHPLVYMTYIVPAVSILIFLKFDKGMQFFWKIRHLLIFFAISLLVGLPQFYTSLSFALKSAVRTNYGASALSTTSAPSEWAQTEAIFNKAQVVRMVTDNHEAIFVVAAVVGLLFLLTFIAARKFSRLIKILPYVAICGYFAFYIWLFGQGISIYHGGWYRLFWSVPVWLGALVCALWFYSFENIAQVVTNRALKLITVGAVSALVVLVTVFFLVIHNDKSDVWPIIYRSQVSSAYPDVINLNISEKDRSDLKLKLVPPWLNGDETNWRLYDGDQTVNLWWNSYFKMPLARGYLDPPFANERRGYIFWQDAALSQVDGQPQLAQAFNYPQETAISNALSLVDWNAVRYYEGGHEGAAFTPLPKYLENYLVKNKQTLEFNDTRYTNRPVTLTYYEFKDEVTSPILSATNAPALGVFATEGGFETVVRATIERDNINSQKLIPINLGKYVDEYSLEQLKSFDSLYLYDWDFKKSDRAFKLLNNYVLLGRKIFVETGVEVKFSSGQLPDLFPVKKVERRGLGREWELAAGESIYTKDVNFSEFSPPLFDEDEWKFSYSSDTDVRQGSVVVLRNKGKAVLATQKIGSGEVIWSGLNLAYHLGRNHNAEEAKFFLNILSTMVDLGTANKPAFNVEFINANNRTISTGGAKGVLFKEQAYDGWSAKLVKSDGGKRGSLKIYKAGPTYPGYMYVPLSGNNNEVSFNFSGSMQDKILVLISAFSVLLIFEEVALGGLAIGRLRKLSFRFFRRRVGHWWEKEDEQ